MEKETFESKVIDFLSDRMNEAEIKEFEKFLNDHSEYQVQFDALSRTWRGVDGIEVPEPTENMDVRFFEMLQSEIEKEKNAKDDSESWFSKILEGLWKPQVAYSILLLTIGLTAGYLMNADTSSVPMKTTIVGNSETEEVREQLVLTLLDQPSANKRLQGISEANKISKVDETVIKALLKTLNNDPNVNVRLAAIASLTNYLDNPIVREGLVQSIIKQDSPIVQVTLANLMVALQEKKSVEPFRTLMRTKELNESVKEKLETSIKSII
ncbi:HEAT repeat domain-containing protein [Maribacter halichondriae]|uniref:HEAT repeat domain-containing protein n=1 Tax=Maribacter halichondriae TaxID=2980554 RepID=UPI002358A7A7|nr:HEAT repeat domain-containing protein [Maribacter sp. Hal144]